MLERCGHYPNIEQPEQFNRIVTAFLDSASAAGTLKLHVPE